MYIIFNSKPGKSTIFSQLQNNEAHIVMKSSTNLVQNNEAHIVNSIRTNYILVQVDRPKTYFDATSWLNKLAFLFINYSF